MKTNKGGTKLNATLFILVAFVTVIFVVAVVKTVDKKKNEENEAQTTTPPQTMQAEANSSNSKAKATEIISASEAAESVSKPKYEIKINKTFISQDYEQKPVLVVEYEWTNNSDKTVSFTFAVQDNVYQNGIECSSTVFGCNDVDAEQQLTKIQPGTTYTLNVAYMLQDSNADAEIVITDLFGTEELLKTTVKM